MLPTLSREARMSDFTERARAEAERHAEMLQTALRMFQVGAAGEHNVLSDEKAEGFQLAIDNLRSYAQSVAKERLTDDNR